MTFLLILCAIAAGYQATALLACLAHLGRREPEGGELPGVSILKPVHGADSGFDEAIESHAKIDYPQFEILFGVRDLRDEAVAQVRRLQAEHPGVPIRLIECSTGAPNAKVGVLEDLARASSFPVLVVNDGDIVVPRDYLRRLVRSLNEPGVGMVTCLYSASGDSFAARFEALGISTDFAPSALVAPFVGVNEFGLGSTMAFRAGDLIRIGGFAAIRAYIADDYQLGKRIAGLRLKVRMSPMTVRTHLGDVSWSEVWLHQVRWARTIRLSQGLYFGLPVTFATVWAGVAAAAGLGWIAAGLLALRMAVALAGGVLVLRDPLAWRYWWLIPIRDVFAAAVWVAGAVGRDAVWRGARLRLDGEGRIVEREQ